MEKIEVLDKGYVRLVDHMGSDLTVANSARVSFAKESTQLNDKDRGLIDYLAREGHTSPFRHAVLQFELYAPLMVARQWWKYIIGSAHLEANQDSLSAWNESSRRYITEEPAFYVPAAGQWRAAADDRKQGSKEPLPEEKGQVLTQALLKTIEQGEALYEQALAEGVCAEQARLFLPAYGLYVRWYWTVSLQGAVHFIKQREDAHAQAEIRAYAAATRELASRHFPEAMAALLKKGS